MSMQICPSSLAGFDRHLLPRGLEEINRQLDAVLADSQASNKFFFKVNTLPNFDRLVIEPNQLTVADGYTYQIGLLFTAGSYQIMMLLPQRRDGQKKDGVAFDRSIAFYASNVSVERLEQLTSSIRALLRQILKK